RRRHTRSKRDWSSDVCSSDLCCDHGTKGNEQDDASDDETDDLRGHVQALTHGGESITGVLRGEVTFVKVVDELGDSLTVFGRDRSEERRVGKGCRARRETER